MRSIVLAAVAALTLTACEDDYDAQQARLVDLLADKQMGVSEDYWLEKQSALAPEWDKVALFFGFASGDYEACMDVAAAWNRDAAAMVYRCTAAN